MRFGLASISSADSWFVGALGHELILKCCARDSLESKAKFAVGDRINMEIIAFFQKRVVKHTVRLHFKVI